MTVKESYYVGTNTTPLHVEEALRQGIIASDERLLGVFDGIFFDNTNTRVGGLALNDFLVITDRRLTTWARDQFKDYVDHFPLSHVFVTGQKNKDSLHGTLSLEMVLPDTPTNEVGEAEKLDLTFDFVPLLDLSLAYDLIEVMSNLNRDMIAGGASEQDRVKAASVLFEKVFVKRSNNRATQREKTASRAARPQTHTHEEPLYEIVEGEALDDMMTPLHRLDGLDDFNRGISTHNQSPASGRIQADFASPNVSRPVFANEGEAHLWPVADEGRQSRFRQAVGNVSARLGEGDLPDMINLQSQRTAPKPPGVRLREDVAVGGPEGLYTIGRAGRAAWDGLEKLRREAESRSGNLMPLLQNLRDSGMNLTDMTEFLVALNNLLDTLGSSPAAFELARGFINRNVGVANAHTSKFTQPGRADKKPVRVEDAEDSSNASVEDDIPTATESALEKESLGSVLGGAFKRKHAVNLRVERRNAAAVPAVDPADVAPVRHRVAIRSKQNDASLDAPTGEDVTSSYSPADDEIVMLFSKVEVPTADGFDGLSDFGTAPNLEAELDFEDDSKRKELEEKLEVEATTGGYLPKSISIQRKSGAPSGPELN